MKNWNSLKTAITDVIRTNGNQEITGANLQSTLLTMVNSLGANRTFAGLANPSTSPGAPEGPVFYIASTAGTYTNFGNVVVNSGALTLLVNEENSWKALPIAMSTSGNSGQGLTDLEVSADFAELDHFYGYEAAGIYKVTIADYADTQPNYLLVVLSTIDNSSCTQFLFGNFEIFEGGALEYTDAPAMGPAIAVRTGSGAFSAGWSYLYQDSLVTLNTMLKGDVSIASAYATELNSLYGDDKAGLYRIVASADGAAMGMLLVVVTENFTQQYLLGSFEIFEGNSINISAAEPSAGTPTFATRYRASGSSAFSPWSYLYQDLLIKTGNPEYTPMRYDAAKIFALTTDSSNTTVQTAFTPLNYDRPTMPKPGDCLVAKDSSRFYLIAGVDRHTASIATKYTVTYIFATSNNAVVLGSITVDFSSWEVTSSPSSLTSISGNDIPKPVGTLAQLLTADIGSTIGLTYEQIYAANLVGIRTYQGPANTVFSDSGLITLSSTLYDNNSGEATYYLHIETNACTARVGLTAQGVIVSREYLRSKGPLKYKLSKLIALTTDSSEDTIKEAFTPVSSAFAIMPAPGDIFISNVDDVAGTEDQTYMVVSADYSKTSTREYVSIIVQGASSSFVGLRSIAVKPDFSGVQSQGLSTYSMVLRHGSYTYGNIDSLSVNSTETEIQAAFKPNDAASPRRPMPGDQIILGYNSTYKNQYFGAVLYVEDDYTVQDAPKYIITYTAAEGNIHKIAVSVSFTQVYYKYYGYHGLQTGSHIYDKSAVGELLEALEQGSDLSTFTASQVHELCTNEQGVLSIPKVGDIFIGNADIGGSSNYMSHTLCVMSSGTFFDDVAAMEYYSFTIVFSGKVYTCYISATFTQITANYPV